MHWSGDMCLSSMSCFMGSIILLDFLIYMTNVSGCPSVGCPKVCTCETNDLGEVTLTCSEPETVETLAEISTVCSRDVVKMIIKNQAGLTSIGHHSFRNFSNLRHLQIELTGLAFIVEEAFEGSPDLQTIWLKGNPLRCDCTNAWLQNASYLMDADEVTCDLTIASEGRVCYLHTHTGNNNTIDSKINNGSHDVTLLIATPFVQCGIPCVSVDSNIIEVAEGNDVSITCRTCNKVIPAEITWLIKDFQSTWNLSTDPELDIHVLQLHNFRHEDNYRTGTCLGNNSYGSNSSTVRLVIPSSPKITYLDFFNESQRLYIQFKVECWPPPTTKWLKFGKLLPNNRFIVDAEIEMNSFGVFTGYRLLNPVGPTTNGLYTLVANNREGSANRTINITVLPSLVFVPPIIPEFPQYVPKTVANTSATSTSWRPASDFEIFLAATAGISGTVLVVVISACIRHKLKHPSRVVGKMPRYSSSSNRKQENFNEDLPLTGVRFMDNPYYNRRGKKNQKTNKLHIKTVKLETILLIRVIGEGAFGRVFLGSCLNLVKKDEVTVVAVKMLKGEGSDALKKDLEREAEILSSFEHQNIITFYGICTEGENWMMILEFMEHGDLNKYIRNHCPEMAIIRRGELAHAQEEPLTLVQLHHVAAHIANGMEYLASQHFVHRDLATRNCLVDSGLLVKIGDFGMSRDVYSTDYYKVGGETVMLPIRWMSAESILYRTFTVESDVWSFGVTLWEVFTYGKQPWFEYSNLEVIEHIKNRHLLKRPPKCPESVYKIMLGCWRLHPQDRLSMKEICSLLNEDILSNQQEYLEIIP